MFDWYIFKLQPLFPPVSTIRRTVCPLTPCAKTLGIRFQSMAARKSHAINYSMRNNYERDS